MQTPDAESANRDRPAADVTFTAAILIIAKIVAVPAIIFLLLMSTLQIWGLHYLATTSRMPFVSGRIASSRVYVGREKIILLAQSSVVLIMHFCLLYLCLRILTHRLGKKFL